MPMASEPLEPRFNAVEVELLQDAVAGWLAHYLIRAERMDGEAADGFDFESMTAVGRKLGMKL
jgi:hypothetical protein